VQTTRIKTFHNTNNEQKVPCILIQEVEKAIKMSPNNNAAGIDCIPHEAVKACGETGVKWLHRIFTVAWNERKVPADWQKTIITPI
jgi:hypothetical protein